VFAGLFRLPAGGRSYTQNWFTWISAGHLHVNMGLLVDPLSMTMAAFVTGVSALIHLYSIGYMEHDEDFPKFFLYLNLFVAAMLLLVLANNFLLLFLGWEGVGVCSYFLIGFWFERDTASSAAKKAMIFNRIGDAAFLVALFLIYERTGSLDYHTVFSHLGSVGEPSLVAMGVLLFAGAVGKSAQIPLYPWLADAMEGPTPVSALIHAATMVTAGVYLMCRINPILYRAPDAAHVIAIIGAVTALLGATIACAQNDIKKILAYSTISQLGYMFLAAGIGAYDAAIFLMLTHAFYKALLFLGAGSVIHAMNDDQDVLHRMALDRRPTGVLGLLVQGRRALERLRVQSRPVGGRRPDRRAHGLLPGARLSAGVPGPAALGRGPQARRSRGPQASRPILGDVGAPHRAGRTVGRWRVDQSPDPS
jgi:NADH-quinone oxidoreductase subunit L